MIYLKVLYLKKQKQTKKNFGESDEELLDFLISYFFYQPLLLRFLLVRDYSQNYVCLVDIHITIHTNCISLVEGNGSYIFLVFTYFS